MKLHGNFQTGIEGEKTHDDVSRITRLIAQAIHGQAWKIFESCPLELLNESPAFIATAVWGLAVKGGLTPLQHRISERASPIIEEVLTALQLKELNGAQRFAIDYLVRTLITIEISFAVQILRFEALSGSHTEKADIPDLSTLEVLGNA